MGLEVPKMGLEVPKMGLEVPKMGLEVPKMGLEVPKMGLGVPKMGLEVPKMGLEVPKMGLEVPKMGLGVPGNSQKLFGASLTEQNPAFGVSQNGSTNPSSRRPLMARHDGIPDREQDLVDLCQRWKPDLENSSKIAPYGWDRRKAPRLWTISYEAMGF